MLDLKEIKQLHDKAYFHNQTTRERAATDMIFYWITHWDESTLGESSLGYRGEFDILRKAGRQIIGDLRANPIQINFKPVDDEREDGADLLDGLYLSDDRVNTSKEAYENASSESVVCGAGAWELYTTYVSNRAGNETQVIRRRPIHEANGCCFWDPNATSLDKSDARYVSLLTTYSYDGYRELIKEETGEDIGDKDSFNPSSFAEPEHGCSFDWVTGEGDVFYVGSFYHKEKVNDKVFNMEDPFGQPITLLESDLIDHMDELIDSGYTIESERKITRWQVTKYITSGERIISDYVIAGENIPVIPVYGERAFVGGEEHYEGITRLAKDPQMLRDFQLSYLADIVSRSPRPKPIFMAEQLLGHEHMYQENGADSNFPYLLQNRVTANGEQLPVGPMAQMPEQPIPSALIASIDLSRQAVEDVANPGIPQDIADPDLSGKAVIALQNRMDQQSIVYQQNLKHAKRRDGEVYASMASAINDTPRKVMLTLPDGTTKNVEIMETVIDKETGEALVLNDLTNMEFNVFAEIGPSYSSKKEQTIDQLSDMAQAVAAVDPALMKLLVLKQATLIDGVAFDDVREYARKQLILSGVTEPETEEEEQMFAQAQQGQQPDPMMIAAQAASKEADAKIMREQRQAQVDQAKAQNEQGNLQVDIFKAQTDRASVEVDAQKAGADIEYTKLKSQGQQIDNAFKAVAPRRSNENFRARVN